MKASPIFKCDACNRTLYKNEGDMRCLRCLADYDGVRRLYNLATVVFPALKSHRPAELFARLLVRVVKDRQPDSGLLPDIEKFLRDETARPDPPKEHSVG